jgi:hypothetical protein
MQQACTVKGCGNTWQSDKAICCPLHPNVAGIVLTAKPKSRYKSLSGGIPVGDMNSRNHGYYSDTGMGGKVLVSNKIY